MFPTRRTLTHLLTGVILSTSLGCKLQKQDTQPPVPVNHPATKVDEEEFVKRLPVGLTEVIEDADSIPLFEEILYTEQAKIQDLLEKLKEEGYDLSIPPSNEVSLADKDIAIALYYEHYKPHTTALIGTNYEDPQMLFTNDRKSMGDPTTVAFYDIKTKKMYVGLFDGTSMGEVASSINHESMHHVQNELGLPRSKVFREGHTKLIQHEVDTKVYETTGNTYDYFRHSGFDFIAVYEVYLETCERNNVEPKTFSLQKSMSYDPQGLRDWPHAEGLSLFKIRHLQWGDRVISDPINNDYCTILYSPQENDCSEPVGPEMIRK